MAQITRESDPAQCLGDQGDHQVRRSEEEGIYLEKCLSRGQELQAARQRRVPAASRDSRRGEGQRL